MPVTVEWCVSADPQGQDAVFVAGDHSKLGCWLPEAAIPLNRCDLGNDGKSLWQTTIVFEDPGTIRYRYFIGRVVQDQQEKHVIVKSWDGFTQAREAVLPTTEQGPVKISDTYGQTGKSSGSLPGWLTTQSELRLTWRVDKSCRVKCAARNISEELPVVPATVILEDFQYVDLSTDNEHFSDQPEFGVPVIGDTSYLVFRGQTVHPEDLGVQLTFFHDDLNAGPGPHPVEGQSQILPSMFIKNSTGILNLPVKSSDGQVMRHTTVEYVFIKPISTFQNTLEDPHQIWDTSLGPADTGHRGSGKCRSRAVPPHILENTVKSFNTASQSGADYVEFDVQLTKDKVPIVFHDFLCRLPPPDANSSHEDVFVKNLNYKELFDLEARFAVETGTKEKVLVDTSENVDENEALFPTLDEVFEKVDPRVGFNVEVKFPEMLEGGGMEDGVETFFDANEYLDLILARVCAKAGNRKVFLSCFCPNICIMLQLKQNRFGVQFLTQGLVPQYEPYRDLRARDLMVAFRFAAAERFMGVNMISDFLKSDFLLVKCATDLGLVLMCWGIENNNSDFIEELKQNGVQNVIYDRIMDYINPEKKKN